MSYMSNIYPVSGKMIREETSRQQQKCKSQNCKVRFKARSSRRPCTKSKMTVASFVLVNVDIQQPLTEIIWPIYCRNETRIKALVKLFHVLRVYLLKLKAEYGGLQHSYKINTLHTSFTRPDGVEMKMRYISRALESQQCPGSSLSYAEGLEGFNRFGGQVRKCVVK
jgi:hypothetical protein